MKIKDIWSFAKETFTEWREDKATRLAAALAYYTAFSITPLLVIALAVAGAVWGPDAASGGVQRYLESSVGPSAAKSMQDIVAKTAPHGAGFFATIISVVVLFFGASGVFAELQDSMNTIWEVQPRPGLGIWNTVKNRFISFSMVLGMAFLLMVSLLASTLLTALTSRLGVATSIVGQGVDLIVSTGVITLLFAAIFKFLPDVKIKWRDVWIGALLTAVLFTIGKFALGLYLGRMAKGSVFQAAGSLAALLVWVFYSAQILFFGAEFTQVYAKRTGSALQPTEHAVAMTEDERERQGIPRRTDVEAAAQLTDGHSNSVAAVAVPYAAEAAARRQGHWRPLLVGVALGSMFPLVRRRGKPVRRQSNRRRPFGSKRA